MSDIPSSAIQQQVLDGRLLDDYWTISGCLFAIVSSIKKKKKEWRCR
jgi:hypothetical protein